MQFLYPGFLYALATLLIPILIHLFYFRRFKTVYFSNVRFLSQLREEKQTRSRLKHWLTLITRLLILASLVFAFAQPYFPGSASGKPQSGKNAVSIYIDNSFSMRSVGEEGDLIQAGKEKAREISEAYREADVFQLLTNDFQVSNQAFVQRSDLLPKIDRVKASPAFRELQLIVDRQTALLRDEDAANKTAFIISDFQKTSANLEKLSLDSTITYYFIPLKPGEQGNVFIDSAWLNTPTLQADQNHRMKFRITNTGDEQVEDLTTKLRINGQQKGLATTTVPPHSQDTGSVVFMVDETGWNTGQLSIKDYPITFDDKYYLSYPVAKQANILTIYKNKPNRYIKAAYNTDAYFKPTFKQQGNLRYDNFSRYDLIILDQLRAPSSGLINEVEAFAEAGGNVLVLPPDQKGKSSDENPYQQLMSRINGNRYQSSEKQDQAIASIQLTHPLFQNIFSEIPDNVQYPKVNRYYNQTQYTAAGGQVLMRLANGKPFFTLYPHGGGHVFASTIPMNGEWSNMTKNALFIPLMYKIALYQDQPFQLAYKIGQTRRIRLNQKPRSKDQVFKLKLNDYTTIPSQQMRGGQLQMFFQEPLPKAGIYTVEPNRKAENAGKASAYPKLAFNFSREESVLTAHNTNAIQQALQPYPNAQVLQKAYGNVKQSLSRVQKGAFIWKYFIWAALGFLLIEVLLLKFLK